MGNPPAWVAASKHAASHTEVQIMAGIAAGLVTAGDVNSQPAQTGGLSLQSPALWAHIWFAVALLYLIGIYFGHIRISKIS